MAIGVVVMLGLVAAGLVVLLPPDHRLTFLIDASASDADFREVADAVGAAARNVSDDDAVALRRLGGDCDRPDNTAEVVPVGAGQGGRIDEAAHAIAPGGRATLLSGILAAIDDYYPFRGEKSNRVVVVARNGVEACEKDAAAVRALVEEHSTCSCCSSSPETPGRSSSPGRSCPARRRRPRRGGSGRCRATSTTSSAVAATPA
ncbi:hypothetical protein [Saccharothrix sp. NRRL B-16348]|uniref:hypothetical protein n=1 Tax=Saccharothrix sp. NRRL B-16348 TaxID=1415542 RepID=UPI0006B014F9|nr:hypothetical protein [Saccharothrix sp. NRRL B-16348]